MSDAWRLAVSEQQVSQVQMDVPVRSRMLVEMEDRRATVRMSDRDPRLLVRLPDRRILGRLAGLEVTARLEPAAEAPMEMEQHRPGPVVDDDGGCRHVRRERRADEGVLGATEQPFEVRDGVPFLGVQRRVVAEPGEQLGDARVAGDLAQLRTSLLSTAPVPSSS